MKRGLSVAMVIIWVVVFRGWARSVQGQDQPPHWQVVGQVGGPIEAVAVYGQYAYVGVGRRMVVLDISNPAALRQVGATAPFPYSVQGIAVQSTHAYVAAGAAGLRVVDISRPAEPIEIGSWDSPGYAEGVAAKGDSVYLADGPYGLCILNVSNPAVPTVAGSAYELNYAFDVAVDGRYAYLASGGAGLLVVDVSSPAHALQAGKLDTPGYAYDVVVASGAAYLADGWDGLKVVNLSNPTRPTLWGAYDTPGWALGVAVVGATAYVADGAQSLRVIDVADHPHPRETGAYAGPGFAREVAASGSSVFVADLQRGLLAISTADPAHPAPLASYSPLSDARRLAVAGSHAYVASGYAGLRVVDISDPGRPWEVSSYDTEGGYASSVVVSGSYAYLATYIAGPYSLHVIDISDPLHPSKTGTVATNGAFREIALQGQIVYAADEWGLRLISVQEPSHPVEVGFVQLNQSQQDTVGLAIAGNLVYVADALDGVKIVDVSDPARPILVGVCDTPGFTQGVAVSGHSVYAADSQHGLRIMDVSDPAAPREVGSIDTPGCAESVVIAGSMAYVSDGGGGVQVVEISDPSNPELAGSFDTTGFAWYTYLAGGNAYVADGRGGLLLLGATDSAPVKRAGEDGAVARTGREVVRTLVGAAEIADPAGSSGLSSGPWAPLSSSSAGGPGAILSWPTAPGEPPTVDASRRGLANACVVTSRADSGPGTLRDCLLKATRNSAVSFSTVVFPPANPMTITLDSPLPPLTQGYLTLDASQAGVVLDGSRLPGAADGLRVQSDGNTIWGLQILNFGQDGIIIDGAARSNVIGGNRAQGAGPTGRGNRFSGNLFGIHIQGEGATGNRIVGNLVGMDATGAQAAGNEEGVVISGGASHNQVGGSSPAERNVLSGNRGHGLNIIGQGVAGNVVVGNYIGTDASGARAMRNGRSGMVIQSGACGNVVGGADPAARNVISGNEGYAIIVSDPGTANNVIIGNYIGTDPTGMVGLGNGAGILIWTSGYNRVGGTAPGERNIIVASRGYGISIGGLEHSDNLVLGNYVGTDVSGARPLANGVGVCINEGTRHNFVGGATEAEGNVIAGNQTDVQIENAGIEHNWILGNKIGTDVSATRSMGTLWAGVLIRDHASHNLVQGNIIAHGGQNGIHVNRARFNTIRRNAIYNHLGEGIALVDDGNDLLLAPVLSIVTAKGIAGLACPGCTIEIFSDTVDEGGIYEGTAIADSTGVFSLHKGEPWVHYYVKATATDCAGNTSRFSAPRNRGGTVRLPLFWR